LYHYYPEDYNKATVKTSRSKAANPRYILGLVATLACLLGSGVSGCQWAGGEQAHEVTFEQLFANPGQYHGRQITLEGFYFQGFEVIVLSERLEYSGYAEGHLVPGGRMLWVEGGIPLEIYNQLYQQQMMGPSERYGKVNVSGEFRSGGQYGHLGAYDYQITPSEVELLNWSPP
jgi:hypothetical protein